MKYLDNAMDILTHFKIVDTPTLAYIVEEQGALKLQTGNLKEAKILIYKALSLYLRIGDKLRIAETNNSLSDLFLKTREMDSVQFYSEKSLQLANKIADSLAIIADAATNLSKVFEYKNNFKEALSYYKMASNAKDSNFNHEKINKLTTISFQGKQRELENIAAKKQYQSMVFLYSSLAGLFVCLVIASILLYSNTQKQKAKLNIQKAYQELESTQKQLIQSEKMASLGGTYSRYCT